MNFLDHIFANLREASERVVLRRFERSRIISVNGAELLRLIRVARAYLGKQGIRPGDRCVILAANSIRWAALDLAIMAEGAVAVPLYARQAPKELVAMMQDCAPSVIFCGTPELRDSISANWKDAPKPVAFDDVFERNAPQSPGDTPRPLADADPVAIIYTSGTSGEPKGVVLNAGNLTHMLHCTRERLDRLMSGSTRTERVFHYLPFCFAGSWILLLSCLSRNTTLTISADLTRLGDEIRDAAPEYFLNVPTLLEHVRGGILEQVRKKGGMGEKIFFNGEQAWLRSRSGKRAGSDWLWLWLANRLVFSKIRRKIGPNLRALICGSAPLAVETQLFFMMLSIAVLQVYGLTETTAICTMDDPGQVEPGKVGPAIPGVEMRVGENDEILVRGPNIFPGYWQRPEATAAVLRDGWFHTGDQGEVDAGGNWKIIGRLKNLIILNSGHNIPPEPIEEMLTRQIRGAEQVVLIGNGRGHLTALVTGKIGRDEVQAALDALNPQLPHYKRVHGFHVHEEPFSADNGLLTANGKLKRDAIAVRFEAQIQELYCARQQA